MGTYLLGAGSRPGTAAVDRFQRLAEVAGQKASVGDGADPASAPDAARTGNRPSSSLKEPAAT
jgi:hypothetical protein